MELPFNLGVDTSVNEVSFGYTAIELLTTLCWYVAVIALILISIRWFFVYRRRRYPNTRAPPDTNHNNEQHLPSYNFCGAGTQIDARLARGDKPVNDLDACCMVHDQQYDDPNITTAQADDTLMSCARSFKPRNDLEGMDREVTLHSIASKKAMHKRGWLSDMIFRTVEPVNTLAHAVTGKIPRLSVNSD